MFLGESVHPAESTERVIHDSDAVEVLLKRYLARAHSADGRHGRNTNCLLVLGTCLNKHGLAATKSSHQIFSVYSRNHHESRSASNVDAAKQLCSGPVDQAGRQRLESTAYRV